MERGEVSKVGSTRPSSLPEPSLFPSPSRSPMPAATAISPSPGPSAARRPTYPLHRAASSLSPSCFNPPQPRRPPTGGAVAASAGRRVACSARPPTTVCFLYVCSSSSWQSNLASRRQSKLVCSRRLNFTPSSSYRHSAKGQGLAFGLYILLTVGDVEEQTWDEVVLGCETAVLVAFWAPWCGPCRLMHPIIADLAKAYAGRLRCLRVNTDENQEVASRYGIRSIPTILIFKDGERKETVIGAIADTALAATVDRFL
uniref:Thioredoxin domain-containing protein n=1 Tax=Aegilops tauschii subsp. strangulata TaxID=200361 RepID=A0A453TDD1_AEGTS